MKAPSNALRKGYFIMGGRRSVCLDKSVLIARGGEGTVYVDPDNRRTKAIKIYHNPNSHRQAKLLKLLSDHRNWPNNTMAPLELAEDHVSQIVGFGMPLLNREYIKLSMLFKPSVCADFGFNTRVRATLMQTVGQDLRTYHYNDIVVGDLNDGVIMVSTSTFRPAWVDIDSWSIPGFPCIVGTLLYLSPALYNIADLSTGDYFKPEHDWWSYTVLLVRTLLQKHPFKAGTHREFASPTERATRRITMFDPEVAYPSVGLKPELLSDNLLTAVIANLKGPVVGSDLLDVLSDYCNELVQCQSCGIEYPASRVSCPVCAKTMVAQIFQSHKYDIEDLIEGKGRVLYVQVDELTVNAFVEESGQLVLYCKEDQKAPIRIDLGIAYEGGMQLGIFGSKVTITIDNAIEERGEVYILEANTCGISHVSQATTGLLAGQGPVMATSCHGLYSIQQNYLKFSWVTNNTLLSQRVTQIYPGQCWFACDPNPLPNVETVFGFNRDIHITSWFLAIGNVTERRFQSFNIPIGQLMPGESLKALSVRFDTDELLLMRKTLWHGAEIIRLDLIKRNDGSIMWSREIDPTQIPYWDSISGKGFKRRIVLHPTDDGIVVENLNSGGVNKLDNTASFVTSDSALIPYGPGVLIVRCHRVSLITKTNN